MLDSLQRVLSGRATHALVLGDRLEIVRDLPDDSIDLIFTSPPYERARTYNIDFPHEGQDWVNWMVAAWKEFNRVTKGLVACVCEGVTNNYRWSGTPVLLGADLSRKGWNEYMYRDRDSVIRLLYVMMTRAREKLVLCHRSTSMALDLAG